MKKLLAIVMVLLAIPFVLADTNVDIGLWTSEDLNANIDLGSEGDSNVYVNGGRLLGRDDIKGYGQTQNVILEKIIQGITAVDETDWEGTPLMLTKTGLNDFSMSIAWALYNHYVPRRDFEPIARTAEYNALRITAIEMWLEQNDPDGYCEIKRQLMEEYDLPYISCVNGVGEYVKYENPKQEEVLDEHGCNLAESELWCENTRECYIPGEDYCDGMIVTSNEEPEEEINDEENNETNNETEYDEYGCLFSEGYTWNEDEMWCVKEDLDVDDPDRYQDELYFGEEDEEETPEPTKEAGEDCISNDECISGICYINSNTCAPVVPGVNHD